MDDKLKNSRQKFPHWFGTLLNKFFGVFQNLLWLYHKHFGKLQNLYLGILQNHYHDIEINIGIFRNY